MTQRLDQSDCAGSDPSAKEMTHLGPSVQLDRSQLGVVQLLNRSKVDVAPGHPLPKHTVQQQRQHQLHAGSSNASVDPCGTHVHLTRLEDDLGSRSAGQLGSLPDQRVEEVDGVVVTDGVDGHVPVDAGYCA